jgi:hypothetical protein
MLASDSGNVEPGSIPSRLKIVVRCELQDLDSVEHPQLMHIMRSGNTVRDPVQSLVRRFVRDSQEAFMLFSRLLQKGRTHPQSLIIQRPRKGYNGVR